MPSKVQLSEIDSTLTSIVRETPGWEPTEWTRRIKQYLIERAKTHGCECYASQCANAHGGEWLYDVIWLRAGKGERSGLVTDSPLVAEIEWWNEKAVMDDFQKLLLARAETRLMVFAATSSGQGEQRLTKLIEQVRAYSRTEPGDRYIFACLDNCHSAKEPYNVNCREYVHPG